MQELFNKFKKRVWRDIFVTCGVIALAAALLAVIVVLLACRLSGVDLFWVFYVLIGIGAFALGGGIAFMCLRTTDEKIAKRLDFELGLQERVQTAYVYRNESSDMLDLQRDDATAELRETPVKTLAFANLVLVIILSVVLGLSAVALPVITICVPVESTTERPPVDLPRPITDWEWEALDALIEHVRDSKKADANAKSSMLDELESLRGLLLNGVSQNGLKNFVQNTITNIRNAVRDANENAVSDAQAALNSEEQEYVIEQLYVIFELSPPVEPIDPDDPPDEKDPDDDDDDTSNEGGGTGTGELNGIPFYDPENGYIGSNDEARSKYRDMIDAAYENGEISRQEWEQIINEYFNGL